ncbi:acid phosphatase/Vanadium-dependent haloperoxidase [Aspergillus ellipticus CBS 707.79]|uniref:Acid phosphatase/Vanadium-dependent haloperoxidase n=1 Tax=Aspergillus ellipticus CBS 707.79 TaxID=1448320 RepID=A0A319D4B0_9EURO|nr:acid phosphatase/Vanadium-dependent haloperoxidase [Aspergillus ellipticus CBS 707.79]
MASSSHKPEHSADSAPTSAVPKLHILVHTPKRLVLSYIIDWVLIIGIGLIGYGFSRVTPNHRPFFLTDASISFPHKDKDTVTTSVLVVVSLVVPAVVIVLVAALLIPRPGTGLSRALLWRYKVWEWHVGWLGLGLSYAGAYMATEGLKDLYGKPRPDFLARCAPGTSDVASYGVSGLGTSFAGAITMVTWDICRNKSNEVRVDGFSSFPSGHSSLAFAGLAYLTLWLCSKFSVGFPNLTHPPDLQRQERGAIRTQGAAPPIYMLIAAFVPLAVAFFISASRWFDFRHHGFDIIFGSVLGMVFAWVGFRMFQFPLMRGAGWSWGARSRRHAFFHAVGLPGHVAASTWGTSGDKCEVAENRTWGDIDIESGRQISPE